MLAESKYYNPQKMLSYNRILNFIIGARGIGKSYSMKEYPIRRFLKTGEQMIYVRRYRSELRKVINYFDDIKDKFPGHEFKVKGKLLLIDDKVYGWAIPLSMWQSEKSNAYPKVGTIIFDEFIREKDNSGYLPNEVQALLNLMDTVFRDRENVRCICMSNAVSLVNPYFLYFDLVPDTNKRFNAYKNILVEIPESREFSSERRKTKFGSLIDGTEYGDMSLDNEFINDSNLFIERKTKESRFQFALIYKGMTMGIWVDVDAGLMFISNDYDPSSRNIFALTTDDINENAMLMTGWRNNYYLFKMVRAFMNGYLRFDNQVLRNIGYEMFKKMRIQ
jgi:hypothetical protein